ncbi:MAG: histidine phosphatase family protein [Gemmatimonadetes bacterium]|nr:histidine phosphatase family protein [Gemmatimonadota bacterium]
MQTKAWIKAYGEADVILDNIPAETLALARRSGVIVSSTLRRCQQSAQALSQNGPFLTDAVFAEPDPPHWTWRFPALPLLVWGSIFWLAWFAGLPTNSELRSQATARARKATDRLVELAREHGSVFHVGHGLMTTFIARRLMALGWSGPKRSLLDKSLLAFQRAGHWECRVYRM